MSDKKYPTLLDDSEIEEIEIKILERSSQLLAGEHRSKFTGSSGIEFATVREWEPGDEQKRIAWAHSLRNQFRKLVIRESVEERTMDVVLVLDASTSAYCGMSGALIAHAVARITAIIGFSANVTQDRVGAVIFGGEETTVPLKSGRDHMFALIDAYAEALQKNGTPGVYSAPDYHAFAAHVASLATRPSLIVGISDFLYPEAEKMLQELASLQAGNSHDVCAIVADSSFAFELPKTSSGWIACSDVETGSLCMLPRKQLEDLPNKIREWQKRVLASALKAGLHAVRAPHDKNRLQAELVDFFLERRSAR